MVTNFLLLDVFKGIAVVAADCESHLSDTAVLWGKGGWGIGLKWSKHYKYKYQSKVRSLFFLVFIYFLLYRKQLCFLVSGKNKVHS